MAHTGKIGGMVDSEARGLGWTQIAQECMKHIQSKGKPFKRLSRYI